MQNTRHVPAVLVFAGLDPSGGAGIQADIEALGSHGCHACPVVTCHTVQDTRDVYRLVPVDMNLMVEQARAILEDATVSAIKIGLLGSVAAVELIHTLLRDTPPVPVILDPILASGGGGASLGNTDVQEAMRQLLFPMTTVLTPNSLEARRLAPNADTLEACAMRLLDDGCEFVLVTGTHETGDEVTNHLYGNRRLLESFHWPRLPREYHGSGCTLASSIAGLLAQGNEPMTAIHEAQEYTWEALHHAYVLGHGQLIPNRLFWAKTES